MSHERVIFYHFDVDALYAKAVAEGYRPDTAPRNAEWGERFFHLTVITAMKKLKSKGPVETHRAAHVVGR